MKEASELRTMSVDELHNQLLSLRKMQFNHRLKKASGSLDKPHLVKKVRRKIAKVKTIMTEKAD